MFKEVQVFKSLTCRDADSAAYRALGSHGAMFAEPEKNILDGSPARRAPGVRIDLALSSGDGPWAVAIGAGDGIRTRDIQLGRLELYR